MFKLDFGWGGGGGIKWGGGGGGAACSCHKIDGKKTRELEQRGFTLASLVFREF